MKLNAWILGLSLVLALASGASATQAQPQTPQGARKPTTPAASKDAKARPKPAPARPSASPAAKPAAKPAARAVPESSLGSAARRALLGGKGGAAAKKDTKAKADAKPKPRS